MSNFDSLNQNIFGLTALVVSLIALVTTFIQVLQQYFSSAEGYRRCRRAVMGEWYKGTHRKLLWGEFRFEVVFETPVIFLAPPTNKRGPIANRPINYIDGTAESYQETRVLKPAVQAEFDKQALARVHTADDEKASWSMLLSILQREEEDSRVWDADHKHTTPHSLKIDAPIYTLTVGLQPKIRSWDFMPPAITKPYATTAICHLVEMTAMLGMYWKAFDEINWNLRAEGNGLILTTTNVQGLGVMVVFAVTGKSEFGGNRVVPADKIKELCFGSVPTIFTNEWIDKNDGQAINLEFGSAEKAENTIESLGATPSMLTRFRKDNKHIFSVSFEIIGMLSIVLRIRGSNFRMLPNPTSDSWVKKMGPKAWTIARLMDVFQNKLAAITPAEHGSIEMEALATKIGDHWRSIRHHDWADESALLLETRESIHDALDEIDAFLLDQSQEKLLEVIITHVSAIVDILQDPDAPLNSVILANKEQVLVTTYFDVGRKAVMSDRDAENRSRSADECDLRGRIWTALIFRMLCWLLLHDFNEADVNIVPRDLKGSRMPIYIG